MRILFVGMPESVHTARTINQVSDLGWDLHLFSATPGRPHRDLRNVTVYHTSSSRPANLSDSVRLRGLWPSHIGVERLSEKLNHSARLARIVRSIKPDIVHSMEMQHAGYITLGAKIRNKEVFPPWIMTDWGNDIYLFGRLSAHEEKIRSVLSSCDYYTSECWRDVELAKKFGFQGEVLGVWPNPGGFHLERLQKLRQPGPTSTRRLIVLKGYQGDRGRALVGLRAIELCADVLKPYRLAIYSATPEVELAAELTSKSTEIAFEVIPHGGHEGILRLHGQARLSIGLSISDGISTSLLETIIMGSFPIQSNTACADEWLTDGETGILVPPNDPEVVAAAIRRAISDDQLVDRAAEINARTAAERLEYSIVQQKVFTMYQTVFNKR